MSTAKTKTKASKRKKIDALLNRLSLSEAAKILKVSHFDMWSLVVRKKLFTIMQDPNNRPSPTGRKKIYLVPAEVQAFKAGGIAALEDVKKGRTK